MTDPTIQQVAYRGVIQLRIKVQELEKQLEELRALVMKELNGK